LRLTSDLPTVQVHFDPSHLHQVVWNLCDNAVKHGAGDRGDTVELRAGRVPTSGRPYLEVADRGPGIDAPMRSGSSSRSSPTALVARDSVSSSRASSARPTVQCCSMSLDPEAAACSV
jgi:two-component system sensor histidine kinase PilS (NtrC family)